MDGHDEPHRAAGRLRPRRAAHPRRAAGDGTYRITGQKIFITYGEHDLTDNIIHLVLARLPDAPAGTRGISLFLVPKVLLNDDGTLGPRNDVRRAFGRAQARHPCLADLHDDLWRPGRRDRLAVGEENRGLACMFTMMNQRAPRRRPQGVAIAERAYQQALAYARERRQGRAPGAAGEGMSRSSSTPTSAHAADHAPLTRPRRAICYLTAERARPRASRARRGRRRRAHERASLLTPVAKAFSTDIGIEVASLGVQVHGGMGYVEETGAAQTLRDARIAAIYEGTNGIQASISSRASCRSPAAKPSRRDRRACAASRSGS